MTTSTRPTLGGDDCDDDDEDVNPGADASDEGHWHDLNCDGKTPEKQVSAACGCGSGSAGAAPFLGLLFVLRRPRR